MITYIWPPQSVSVAVPPLEFVLDGVDTTVSRDTVTPSNSRPLPVISLDGSGAVTNPLTDAQLRASAVPVSGPLTDVQLRATAVPVSGPLTDTELRASAVPVSAASLPLPSGAATEATLSALNGKIPSNLTVTSTRLLVDGSGVTQQVSAASLPLPAGAATEATLSASNVLIGAVNETAPASDTADSGLNGRLQRVAQRITSLIAILPASLGQKASASSLATVLSTEQEAILDAIRDAAEALNNKIFSDFGVSADAVRVAALLGNTSGIADFGDGVGSAQTLRVSANLKREGNNLSYNAGATDANSLRVGANLMREGNQLAYGAGNVDANTLRVMPAADYTPPSPSVPAALTLKHATIDVGTAAVRATTDNAAPSSTRRKLRIFMDPDTTTGKLYLGSATVDHAAGATRGEQIFPGVPVEFENDVNDYYLISDTASNKVSIIEVE